MNDDGSRLFDEFARLFGDAASVAQGFQREVESFVRSQAERLIGEMDLVRREDFEAVKDLAARLRLDNEGLEARVAALEARLGAAAASPAAAPPRRRGPRPGAAKAAD